MDELPLQKKLQYEMMRREIQQAKSIEMLRTAALNAVDFMEAQQRTVNEMVRQSWLV